MKSEITNNLAIPSGVTVSLTGSVLSVKGPKGEDSREFAYPGVTVAVQGEDVVISCAKASKREKRIVSTFQAHIRNMIKGSEEGFEYKLKICSGHFPMNVAVSGNTLVVKNFLGEKNPRVCSFVEGVTVKVNGTEVVVSSVSKEKAGLVAGRIEQLCRITNRDRRIFQDGIYIVDKAGKSML